jgi:hypothetical protein
MKRPDTSREDQAKRDLARIEQEREKLFHSTPTAANDDNDPIEVLGKRIARIIGPLIAIGLILYLYATYMT